MWWIREHRIPMWISLGCTALKNKKQKTPLTLLGLLSLQKDEGGATCGQCSPQAKSLWRGVLFPPASSGQVGGTVGSMDGPQPHPFLLGLRLPLQSFPFKPRARRRQGEQAQNSQVGALHCPQ